MNGSVGVVVPAYDEPLLVGRVIETIPAFVDRIYGVDDRSTDGTWAEIRRHATAANRSVDAASPVPDGGAGSVRRVVPIRHEHNRGVGQLYVGDLSGIRAEENGDGQNWGRHGNKRLHGWTFSSFTDMLDYKGEAAGIEVVVDTERGTSKTCCVCGRKRKAHRVHRGLYEYDSCGFIGNVDCNGAENIRTLLLSPERHARQDRDNGCLAQPAVHLFDATEWQFLP